MALRTLCITTDFPWKRVSADALSVMMATRSSTAFCAMDRGTWRNLPSPRRLLDTRGTSSPVLESLHPIDVHDIEGHVYDGFEEVGGFEFAGQLLRYV
jgi:hypothetical protein